MDDLAGSNVQVWPVIMLVPLMRWWPRWWRRCAGSWPSRGLRWRGRRRTWRRPGSETSVAASRTQTREGARDRRLARRRGAAKACVATGNTQLKAFRLLADPGMRYHDLGPDYYERQRDVRARSPATSASSAPSASRSPFAASPNPTQTEQARRKPSEPYRPADPDRPRWPGSAAARPANLHFSG
jgi:hypothetical protein